MTPCSYVGVSRLTTFWRCYAQVAAAEMINSKARDMIKKYGLSKIIDAFGHSLPTVLQLHNYPNFLTKVDIPGTSVSPTVWLNLECRQLTAN